MEVVPQGKQRVLVVDDEQQMLLALEDVLGETFTVLSTTSPQRALELIERERDLAVIVTDQRMPKMNGDELLATIDARCEAQRIMLTGFADLRAVTRAVNTGKLFAYIAKPWNAAELLDQVNRAAQQFRRTRLLTNDRQLLRDLLDHSPDGIFYEDRDLRFVEAKRAFWTMLGLPDRSQLLGRRAGGIPRDVTDRLETQSALAASEELLRKQTAILDGILAGLAEGVVVTDVQGNFLLCNAEAQRILGAGANALSIATWTTVCPMFDAADDAPITVQSDPLARAITAMALSEREVYVCRGADVRTRLNISATPLRDARGVVAGSIALLRDVTEQRRIEERLVQAQKVDAIGRLAGGVAHDFNNLLSIIQTCGELLVRGLPALDPKRVELGHILHASERAAVLTRKLLSFSRQQVIQPKTLCVNDIVRKTDAILRRVIAEHIEIVTELADDLGLVSIDANQLEQIILNLAVNARDAMPEGGELRIETRNVSNAGGALPDPPAGEYVMLAIRDSGGGVDAEAQRQSFEPFYPAEDLGRGVGLGLSTVRGIVAQNGGYLRLENAPRRGTACEIYLKRIDDHAAVPSSLPPNGKRPARSGGAILLVDDEDNMRRIAAAILRRQGHTVLEARRPSDAMQLCARARQPVDLLLTDVSTPESSGPELVAELRLQHPAMNVLYMSGFSTDVRTGKASGESVSFLQKPFTPALLIEAVSEAMPKHVT